MQRPVRSPHSRIDQKVPAEMPEQKQQLRTCFTLNIFRAMVAMQRMLKETSVRGTAD